MHQPLIEFNKALPYKVLILLLSSDLPGVKWINSTCMLDLAKTSKALKVKTLRLKNYLIYLNQLGLISLDTSKPKEWSLTVRPLKNYIKTN